MRWIVSLLVNSIVLIAVSGLLKGIAPDAFYIANIQTAIIASIILAILNVFVKPFLILITLPITVVTFGFFLIVINAITLKMTDSLLGDAFNITGFGVAIVAAICISIFNMIIEKAIVEPLYEKKKVTKGKTFHHSYEMFSINRNRISCFQKKMVQYPVEWNFTSNETEPAADGGLYICRK